MFSKFHKVLFSDLEVTSGSETQMQGYIKLGLVNLLSQILCFI
jgi:hypothetical protein